MHLPSSLWGWPQLLYNAAVKVRLRKSEGTMWPEESLIGSGEARVLEGWQSRVRLLAGMVCGPVRLAAPLTHVGLGLLCFSVSSQHSLIITVRTFQYVKRKRSPMVPYSKTTIWFCFLPLSIWIHSCKRNVIITDSFLPYYDVLAHVLTDPMNEFKEPIVSIQVMCYHLPIRSLIWSFWKLPDFQHNIVVSVFV